MTGSIDVAGSDEAVIDANVREVAALGMEPWVPPDSDDLMSPAKWLAIGERDIPFINMARFVLSRTKPQLMEMFRKEPAISMRLADDLKSTGEDFHGIGDMLEGGHARLLVAAAALCVAEEQAGDDATLAPVDPMLDFVDRYRTALRDFDDAKPHTDESCDTFCVERFDPLRDEAQAVPPVTTSEDGAREAIRLALFLIDGDDDETGLPLLTSALAFFDGRAA